MTEMSKKSGARRKDRSGLIGGLGIVVVTAAILWVLAANEMLNASTSDSMAPHDRHAISYGVQPD